MDTRLRDLALVIGSRPDRSATHPPDFATSLSSIAKPATCPRGIQAPGGRSPPPHHTVKTFAVFTGASLVGIGFYALAPGSFTGTTKDGHQYEESWSSFKDAWTKPPVFDSDNPAVNFLGHPYFGSLFYLSQRNYGESPLYSFLFSTFMSTAFEYFIESW